MNENLEQGISLWFCLNYAMLPLHKKQQQHFCSRINISNRSLRLATKYASNSKGLYAKAIIIVFVINVQNAPKRKIKMLNMLRQQMYD